MKHPKLLALALLLSAALAGPGGAAPRDTTHIAQNGMLTEVDGNRIEVYFQPGAVGADFFCAAGDVALRRLGAADRDTLTLTKALSPSGTRPNRRSVVLTLGPPTTEKAFQALVLWPYRTGDQLRVWVGASLCGDRPGKKGRD